MARVPTPDPALQNKWRSRDEIIASTRARSENRVPAPRTNMSSTQTIARPNTGMSSYSTNRVPTPQTGMSSTSTTRVPAPTTGMSSTSTNRVPTPPNSPSYRDQVNDLLSQYREMANTPFQYDPANDPRYQAYRDLAQQQAQVASRNAMETMNERGILNSSLTSNQLGQIQQNAEQQALAAIPQFYDQAYNQYQNRLNTLGNLANMYAQQDDTMFNRGVTEAGLTGQYVPSQARPIIDQLFALKERGDVAGQSPEYYQNLKDQADPLRNQLRQMGVDPSFIESNVTGAQARQNIPNAFATQDARNQQFNQNMAQQQMEYQAARDAIADQRWQQEFDEDVRRFGLNYALDRQIRQGNLDVSRMNAATSRMNAVTNQQEAARRQQEYEQSLNQTEPPTTQEIEANYASMIEQIPSDRLSEFFENEQSNIIRDLGISGYNRLRSLYLQDEGTNFNYTP